MEKRKEKRVKKRILSSLEERPAIIVDISQSGIQISMSSTPKNQMVSVIDLEGDIRWINKTISSQSSSNIGIAIHEAPAEYLQLLKGHA
jgi:S1-C subfamily serine protease